jgi:hypothetical protein
MPIVTDVHNAYLENVDVKIQEYDDGSIRIRVRGKGDLADPPYVIDECYLTGPVLIRLVPRYPLLKIDIADHNMHEKGQIENCEACKDIRAARQIVKRDHNEPVTKYVPGERDGEYVQVDVTPKYMGEAHPI